MNEEKILNFINEKFKKEQAVKLMESKDVTGITASEIEENLNISRNNASTILNKLNKESKLIKIETRPVYFLPKAAFETMFKGEKFENVYSAEELIQKINGMQREPDPFLNMIGSNRSLKYQIEQAKAAILYPPRGLHTLLIGESGTGKSLFAKLMHRYGMLERKISLEEYPYIEFNCADYSSNPQLLMSQLFGYVKGAFTGADIDKKGLVEVADRGILFLDEVHRLPPEGQEMLFLLMDTKKFHRLGEVDKNRIANVLIIAATTENPQRALLKTFIRRIPSLIELPSYREKCVEERVELIEYMFLKEAGIINRDIEINPELIKKLAACDFEGNIGQLESEVKMLCAKSFLESEKSEEKMIITKTTKSVSDLLCLESNFKNLEKDNVFLKRYNSKITIKPNNEINYSNYNYNGVELYKNLKDHIKKYSDRGLDKSRIKEYLNNEIDDYYKNMVDRFTKNKIQLDDLYKLIDKKIVNFTMDSLSKASEKLKVKIDKKCVVGFAFHIKYLLEQSSKRKKLSEDEIQYIEDQYCNELEIAEEIVISIKLEFGMDILDDEKYLLALLLANINEKKTKSHKEIGIIVMAHGDATASSMANVCNELLGIESILAIDMPLYKKVEETYNELISVLKLNKIYNQIVLLVDMGSLINFGERVKNDLGVEVKTIPNVSTPILLEIARDIVFKNHSISDLSFSENTKNTDVKIKPYAILSVCVTGEGVSKAFKRMIQDELQKHGIENVTVLAVNYLELKSDKKKLNEINAQYEFIACIGDIDPKLEVPFFHIEKLVSSEGLTQVMHYIFQALENKSEKNIDREEDFVKSEKVLNRYLTYLNPKLAIKCAEDFIQDLNMEEIFLNKELMVSFPIHVAFMIERNILKVDMKFDNKEIYIKENNKSYEKIKNSLDVIYKKFPEVEISDSEICYMIMAIKGNQTSDAITRH
jgi:transcriptional regulator with AAA-type ATPase domain/transcriptional regulatory protein LevR